MKPVVIPNVSESFAMGINDVGTIAGYAITIPASGASQISQAFVDANGIVTDLGFLPGENDSQANAINASGAVVGFSSRVAGSSGVAFIWTKQAGMNSLGFLGTGNLSDATAVNDIGQVIGFSNLVAGGSLPTRSLSQAE